MKTLTVNGIPYDSTGVNVFVYGSNKTIQLGTYQSDTLSLTENWSTSHDTSAWLDNYRKGLKEATTAALKKAAELQL
jgi:outer membrane scaffolding protein for murein synthesis (MipA/OmpV family)